MRTNRLLVIFGLATLSGCASNSANRTVDLIHHFQGFEGCFVMLDTATDQYTRFNAPLCDVRFSPCSTFKIPHSLIALDSGVLEDEHHIFKWDGKKRWNEKGNRDTDLESAVRHSIVWYFQQVALRVGEARMTNYLNALNYGNQDISGGLTQFWLGNSLKISPHEQIEYLSKLVHNKLPVSKRSQTIVKGLLIQKKYKGKGVLRGKTGSNMTDGKVNLGWFVGYLEIENKSYIFATNIQGEDDAGGRTARAITFNILAELCE